MRCLLVAKLFSANVTFVSTRTSEFATRLELAFLAKVEFDTSSAPFKHCNRGAALGTVLHKGTLCDDDRPKCHE